MVRSGEREEERERKEEKRKSEREKKILKNSPIIGHHT